MAFVSTLGASDANSYLSVARATTLLGDLPVSSGITSWLALATENKQRTLIAATMTINPLNWKGRPTGMEQSLAWPRIIKADHFYLPTDELPIDFEMAVAYMAAFLGSSGGYTAVTGDGGVALQQNSQYDEVELGNGALRVKFKEGDTLQSGIEYIPAFTMDILSRYIIDAGFNQSTVSRPSTARVNPYAPFAPYRPNNVRFVGGKVYPRTGGWYSNPL